MKGGGAMEERLYGCPVGVADMMEAREGRAAAQRRLVRAHGAPLVCLTMNIAGPVKVTREIERAFENALEEIEAQILREGYVRAREQVRAVTGLEAFFVVAGVGVQLLKRLMCEVEDASPVGRLLDADVIGLDGEKLSRTDVGLPVRRCLLCGEEAPLCARSRAHSAEALFSRAEEIIREDLSARYARRVGQSAQRALLYEAAVTPKPGLVDRANSGAHRDMDFFTFLDSAAVLPSYFENCAREGIRLHSRRPAEVFEALQRRGARAERAMLAATGGVNTHKGAIFSLGVVCGALGMLYGRRSGELEGAEADDVLALCGEMTHEAVCKKLSSLTLENARTFGERMYVEHGLAGVRGEAAAGFPSVARASLPAFRAALAAGKSVNDAGVAALLALMANAEDSNVIRRGGLARARALMREAQTAHVPDAEAMDRRLIEENISPGGCADLLAVTFLLYFLLEE